MTVQEIMDLALSNTHTKTAQVSAANQLIFFNISRKAVGRTILAKVDENFFFQIWKRDAVADQNNGEYPYPEADEDSAGMLKCLSVKVKGYDTDTYHKNAREIDIKTLPRDWDYYLEYQSKADPVYFIADESIFIAPQFDSADLPDSPSGNKQLKLYGIAKLIDLAADAVDSAVLIPDDHQPIIAAGMEEFIYKARGKRSEALTAKQNFEFELADMITKMTNRDESLGTASIPDDTNLQFGE